MPPPRATSRAATANFSYSVARAMPSKRAAASRLPPVAARACRMARYSSSLTASASGRMLARAGAACTGGSSALALSGRAWACGSAAGARGRAGSSLPRAPATSAASSTGTSVIKAACSSTLRSSRILPGQAWAASRSRASAHRLRCGKALRRAMSSRVHQDRLAGLDHLGQQGVGHHLLDAPADELMLAGKTQRRQEALVALADPDHAVLAAHHHHALHGLGIEVEHRLRGQLEQAFGVVRQRGGHGGRCLQKGTACQGPARRPAWRPAR